MNLLQFLSAVTAIAAAVLWFLSAIVKTPQRFFIHVVRADSPFGVPLGGNPIGATYVGEAHSEDLVNLATALRRQSRLSAYAALSAGISAAFQAVIMFV